MRISLQSALGLLALSGTLACGGTPAPSPAPRTDSPASPAPTPTPTPTPSPTPAPSPAPFTVVLPVSAPDTDNVAFGLNPFGIHFGGTSPGGHGLDGHPGWDVEFRIGASVLAAADGTVQSVFADSFSAGRATIQIQHQVGGGNYRTVYTNIEMVAPGIVAGAAILRGAPIGRAGSQSQFIGSQSRTWAMTHFQVDDFSSNMGSTNPNAVNPGLFLDASGRELFDRVWRGAAWSAELTEPFTGNPRDVTFPITRTWTRESGSLAARIDFARAQAASSDHTYVMYDAAGTVTERGSVAFTPSQALSSIDLRSDAGPVRAGVVDVVGETMRLDLAQPDGARPADLSGATVYRTR